MGVVLVGDNCIKEQLEVAWRRRQWRQSDPREDIVPTAGWSDWVTDVVEKGKKRRRGGAGLVGRGGAGPVGARRGGGARRAMVMWERKIGEREGDFLWRRRRIEERGNKT